MQTVHVFDAGLDVDFELKRMEASMSRDSEFVKALLSGDGAKIDELYVNGPVHDRFRDAMRQVPIINTRVYNALLRNKFPEYLVKSRVED